MQRREASVISVAIAEANCKFHWRQGPAQPIIWADGVKAVKRRIAGITSQKQSRPASLHETGWAVGKKAILPELNTINFQTRATTARAEA